MNHIIELLHTITERLDRIEESIGNNRPSNLMTIRDVIRYSKYSDSTIRRHIRRGTLKPFKNAGKKLFRRADIDKWLKG